MDSKNGVEVEEGVDTFDIMDFPSTNSAEEEGGDDFIGAVKATRDPWWKRKRIVCPLILSFVAVGIVAAAVGITLSANAQRDGGDNGTVDSADSSPTTTTTDSVYPSSGAPSPVPAASTPGTPSPSARASGIELSGALVHMSKTLSPTDGYVRGTRRPTTSPAPTERSQSPTASPPSLSPTSSSPTTADCHAVEIYIMYDSFPTETSWDISNSFGDVLISYQEEDMLAMTYERTVCLPESTYYQFAIRDVHGDGMLSPGYYSLTSKGEYIDSGCGLDVGHGKISEFSLPWTAMPDDSTVTYMGNVESEEMKQEHPPGGSWEDLHPDHPDFFLDIMEDVFEEGAWGV
mmetsp:Transcript_21139/g.51052  ORF Transcript_21139/g.51052 Transcript_21139/m.51052 type:complete len:346 (+) Transcript_21139:211-1248(+)|eukprot:CAMPEP_0181086904 /NCGR_PEP_ID=MMETSP1071-20121207/5996_1 /TAXON_ID=35127 /ORGANISM="Thalassiosira sp., Strain NH16" /LENGTH=345 /DNA_ID=CAMNT_0023168773 /DNA_START=204 /DNA_END=1241 /DNA_ORIENTATION=+